MTNNMFISINFVSRIWLSNILGPPEPVKIINVTQVSENGANVTFRPGYNYNSTQSFMIENMKEGKWTGI